MTKRYLLIAALLLSLRSGVVAQQRVVVPVASTTPVLIDGAIEADEWADAQRVAFGDSLGLYVKHRAGHVFIAIRKKTQTPRPVDIFLIGDDGKVHQLHASMSTGDRVLEIPWNDTIPRWDWNRHTDWNANDAALDNARDRTLPFSERLIERDGVEFQIRRTRFGGREWKLRIEVSDFSGTGGVEVYPANSERDRPQTWAIFEFTDEAATTDVATANGGVARSGLFGASSMREEPRLRWKFDTRGIVWGPITAAHGAVYFGSQDSSVYAVDLAGGHKRWEFRTGGGTSSGPAVMGQTVYVGSSDSSLYALDAHNGSVRWRYRTGARVVSSPAVMHGIVYTGSDDGFLYALDAESGREVWKHRTGGRVTAPPSVVDGVVYFGSHDGNLYAVSAHTGDLLWSYKAAAGIAWSPVITDRFIVAASLNGEVFALDRVSREKRWQFTTGQWIVGVSADANTVYFGGGDSTLHAIDLNTGRERWNFKAQGGINLTPAIVGDVLYIGSHDGNVYTLDRASGTVLWQYRTDGEVHTAPAVLDGLVVFGSSDNSVYALERVKPGSATRSNASGQD